MYRIQFGNDLRREPVCLRNLVGRRGGFPDIGNQQPFARRFYKIDEGV